LTRTFIDQKHHRAGEGLKCYWNRRNAQRVPLQNDWPWAFGSGREVRLHHGSELGNSGWPGLSSSVRFLSRCFAPRTKRAVECKWKMGCRVCDRGSAPQQELGGCCLRKDVDSIVRTKARIASPLAGASSLQEITISCQRGKSLPGLVCIIRFVCGANNDYGQLASVDIPSCGVESRKGKSVPPIRFSGR
jgi:hypothetical protein